MNERRCDEHVAIGVTRILRLFDNGYHVDAIFDALVIIGVSTHRAHALVNGAPRR